MIIDLSQIENNLRHRLWQFFFFILFFNKFAADMRMHYMHFKRPPIQKYSQWDHFSWNLSQTTASALEFSFVSCWTI